MPAFTADLHNHTPHSSDYRGAADTTPREIVETALHAGLDLYAATDHFSYGFVPGLIDEAERVGRETGRRLLVIPGAELRVRYGDDEAHLTALFPQQGYETAIAALFGMLGFSDAVISRHELPYTTIERDPVRVSRIIDSLGGIAIVAHADREFGGYRLVDSPLFERLLLETTVLAVDMLHQDSGELALAAHDVSLIGCSDSHSLDEIGRRRSLLAMPELTFDGLRTALSRRATVHLGTAC